MDGNTKRRTSTIDDDLVVRADWSPGPRTQTWDRLWRMILSDLGPLTNGGLRERTESEGDDA